MRSRFAVLFLVLAVLLQASVIQTHNHLTSTILSADDVITVPAALSARGVVATDKTGPATPPVCPLCEERALFGSYMLAGPAVMVAPGAIAAWYAPTRALLSIGGQASHAWRSRAPPLA